MRTLTTRICFCVLLVVVGRTATGAENLVARVMPLSGFAPRDVVIQAFIEPDAHNRSVFFTLDSQDLYCSSTVELEGDRAPRTKEVRFRAVPPGSYEVHVTLVGTDGERGRFDSAFELQ